MIFVKTVMIAVLKKISAWMTKKFKVRQVYNMSSKLKIKMIIALPLRLPLLPLSHAHITEGEEICLLPLKGKGPSLLKLPKHCTRAKKKWKILSIRYK